MAAVLSGLECLALAFGTHILHGTVHLSRSAPMICTQILVPYQEMTTAQAAGNVKHKLWLDVIIDLIYKVNYLIYIYVR